MAALQNHRTLFLIGDICRVCLTENENSVDVLGNTELVEHVSNYFGIQINGNEQKSTMLCSSCQGKINDWLADKIKAKNNQIVVEFLATRSSSNHNEREHSAELSTSDSTEYDKTDISPESNTSITASKFTSSCPFCHNYEKTSVIDKKNFCKRHSEPFTCLVPNCYLVFPFKHTFVPHYRSHLNLPSKTYLCNDCYNVLDCSRNERKTKHIHNTLKYTCCSVVFETMIDFVCHKLQEHNGQIVSKRCINENKSGVEPPNQNHKSAKKIKFDQIIDVPIIPESCPPDSEYAGSCFCKHCYFMNSSVSIFVDHSRSKHDSQYRPKEKDIQLCPICDDNYDCTNYIDHISKCAESMKVCELNRLDGYGCIYCKEIFCDMTQRKFRHHLNYCRSFDIGTTEDSLITRKCKNCVFECNTLEKALKHANSYCMSFKLKMKYSKLSNERQRVLDRLSLRKKTEKDIMMHYIKPENTIERDENGKIIVTHCDWSRQMLLGTYNFFCNICTNGFFSLNIFNNHLTHTGEKCRPKTLIYCIRCVTDFESVVKFNKHLPDTAPPFGFVSIKTETNDIPTDNQNNPIILPKSIKIEPRNVDLNEEENIAIDPTLIDNNENDLQFAVINEEINSLEMNESTSYQLSEVSSVGFNVIHESKDLVFNNELFQEEFESPDDVDMQCTVEKEDKSNILNSLASSS